MSDRYGPPPHSHPENQRDRGEMRPPAGRRISPEPHFSIQALSKSTVDFMVPTTPCTFGELMNLWRER